MPRARDPARDQAQELWDAFGGTLKLCDIAAQLHVPESTVRAWKTKDGWGKKNERSAPKKIRSAPNVPNQQAETPTVEQQMAASVAQNEELTEKQKDFCIYFMRNRNATQAYLKSHDCIYATANVEGPACLVNPRIKEELRRLREIKNAALGDLCGADVVELHMRIAFADITEFVDFKNIRRPHLHNGLPIYVDDPDDRNPDGTPKQKILSHYVNEVQFKDSSTVDGQLISEVSQGRDGAKIKLVDRQKSLDFLAQFFTLNPTDRHRQDYEEKRRELDAAMEAGANENPFEELTTDEIRAYLQYAKSVSS